MNELLSVTESAASLAISPRRVRALIAAGRLPATRIGNVWIIERQALDLVRIRKVGRPRK
jgi:excisionase family DNA binding protein